jgi:DNA-binding TFAR19-related protein (PDSD5 family)
MSDSELAAIKRRKLLELQRKVALEQKKAEKMKEANVNQDHVLDKVFGFRAWEVFNAASAQFPEAMKDIKDALVKMVQSGELTEIDGERLYIFLRSLGLNVRIDTEIKFLDKGETKSISQKLQENP